MRRITLLFVLLIALRATLFAGEGMWLPLLLSLNEDDMQSMGMKLSAEDIYSVNQSSLKDAVVLFGRGCTGAVVSDQGLLLTNHHCGYGQIRNQSTPEQNYLRDGFWAQSQAEERPNPGLSVTFIVRIEDVTERVLQGLAVEANGKQATIEKRISEIEREATAESHYQAEVKPFYYGNQYFLIVKEVFTDVRLVGAPPEAIGRFGNETDNWVWPRHNADFSVFRIYSGPDGKPAEYSPENIPLKPKHHFPVSIKGVAEGDFTMVYGFPYQTQEYLPSYAVDQILNLEDPLRVSLRGERLEVYDAAMRANDTIRLMYASKAGISNGYKKWQGRIRGLRRNQSLDAKLAYEESFRARLAENPELSAAYGNLLPQFEEVYAQMEQPLTQVIYFTEGGYGIEALRFCLDLLGTASEWNGADEAKQAELKEKLMEQGRNHFTEYKAFIDRDVAYHLLHAYLTGLPPAQQPAVLRTLREQWGEDLEAELSDYVDRLYARSALTDSNRYQAMVAEFAPAKLQSDPFFGLTLGLYEAYADASAAYRPLQAQVDALMKDYMAAQQAVFSEKNFYPDANQSLRVTYGQVEPMQPRDGVIYQPYTTLDGVVDKYEPGDYEFDLPEKLLELHAARDYGRYGTNGELRVAFIASNHTSGGNSGSPVIDGEGNLIGLNFDRNWEGTMSDIDYDPNQCRNISVDTRYVLFIIDKFADAGYLIEEMTVVE